MHRWLAVVLILASLLAAQTQPVPQKPIKPKPVVQPTAPPIPRNKKLSRDFLVAGRRVLSKIDRLHDLCNPESYAAGILTMDAILGRTDTVLDAIDEASVVRNNAADKYYLGVLRKYADVTQRLALREVGVALGPNPNDKYETCRKEAEALFETGVLAAKITCWQ